MSITKDLAEYNNGNMEAVLIKNRLEKLFLEDRNDKDRYGLHASAVIAPEGEFCYRAQVLSLFFKQDQGHQLPIKSLKIFKQGNAMHDKWYSMFRASHIDIAIERTLWIPEYDLSFTIDAIVKILGKEYIMDIKSQNSFTFTKTKGHPKGETQVNFYLWAYSHYTGKPYKNGFVLVDNKNDSEIKVVPVKYDPDKAAPYIERLKTIQEFKQTFKEEHIMPKRECPNSECKRASKCVMRSACFNTGIGRVPLTKEERSKAGKSE